jgi:NAD dependent epimerase/dehydratase family enzyme
MKFLITGGTGFIGSALVNKLLRDEHDIIILTRGNKVINSKVLAINNMADISSHEKIDVIINLAGAPIDHLWTKK